MIARCTKTTSISWKYYGARGITVCERWRKSFVDFFQDMGPRPSKKHTLDRIDNDHGYEPNNCRWATGIVQANNKRHNKRIVYRDEAMTLAQAVRRAGSVVSWESAATRVRDLGWSVERAVETPVVKPPPITMVNYHGERMRIRDAVRIAKSDLATSTVRDRINGGWDVVKAIETPLKRIFLAAFGKRQTLDQWCEEKGIKRVTLVARLSAGWPSEKALSYPVRKGNYVKRDERPELQSREGAQ